jgi:hypothetical protein
MAEITLQGHHWPFPGQWPVQAHPCRGQGPRRGVRPRCRPRPVTVEWRPFRETLTTEAGLNALIDLDIDGDVALCIVKELQRHPIKGNVSTSTSSG